MKNYKDVEGKLRYDLLPFDAVDDVVRVFTMGAAKYGDKNWESEVKQEHFKLYEAAMLRHMSRHQQGEILDDESGVAHLAHIATNALILTALIKRRSDGTTK